MENDMNFKDFEKKRLPEGDGGEALQFSFPLSRQTSIYSLTFDEFQNTLGGIGKDFGSMNMDEFLKNVWSAEENQTIGSITGAGGQEAADGLQRQGSLTIPRTLSLKTVDDVWQDMLKEYGGGNIDSSGGFVGASGTQKEPILGEMTLEDFLVKAGVVRDEPCIAARPDDHPSSNWNFRFEDHQENENRNGNLNRINVGIADQSNNQIPMRVPAKLPLNISFGGQHEPVQQLQQLLQSPTVVTSNGQLSSPGARGGILGITSPKMNNTGIQGTVLPGGGLGIHGLGSNGVGFPTGSPAAVSSDGLKVTDGGMPSVSPTPYMFSGSRGRKMAAVEKVLERRQRRMIKNRESAARSRARKQAYTKELEEEIANLKEENEELQKKQAGMRAMQKNLIREKTNQQMNAAKRPCLRRTNTGPW